MKRNKYDIQLALTDECTGCTACASICPTNSIIMRESKDGFMQPYIDADTCIKCHKCEKTCPILSYTKNTDGNIQFKPIGYAARNVDTSVRLKSSSGGVFSVIADWIIGQGGAVVAVGYDVDWTPTYKIAVNKTELNDLRGSKYAQASIDKSIFKSVENTLTHNQWVLFVGLACQVEGLYAYLGHKNYEKLICLDLICMGVPSPAIWKEYLSYKFPKKSIKEVNFKDKKNGWSRFSFKVKGLDFEYRDEGMKNEYLNTMFKGYNLRSSCFNCPFKNTNRISDLTLADCWGVSGTIPWDDNLGLSSIIIHTEKGNHIWNSISKNLEYTEVEVGQIIKGNPNIVEHKRKPYVGRIAFYLLRRISPSMTIRLFGRWRPLLVTRIIRKIKKFI